MSHQSRTKGLAENLLAFEAVCSGNLSFVIRNGRNIVECQPLETTSETAEITRKKGQDLNYNFLPHCYNKVQ